MNKIKLTFNDFSGVLAFLGTAEFTGQAFRAARRLAKQIGQEFEKVAEDERAEIERLGGKVSDEGSVSFGKDSEETLAEFRKFQSELYATKITFKEPFVGAFDLLSDFFLNYDGKITPEMRPGFAVFDDLFSVSED